MKNIFVIPVQLWTDMKNNFIIHVQLWTDMKTFFVVLVQLWTGIKKAAPESILRQPIYYFRDLRASNSRLGYHRHHE